MSKKVHVSFILDETGSMRLVKVATLSGFNEYIETLKAGKNAKNVRFTLTKFNSDKIDVVYNGVKLDKVEKLTDEAYQPAALTPLYDAIGQTIKVLETSEKHNVLVVIQTDGQENHSFEFNSKKIFSLIDKKKKDGWTFVFLGADQDAWIVGQKLGLDKGNVLSYQSAETRSTFRQVAQASTHYSGTGGAQTANLFSEAEESDQNPTRSENDTASPASQDAAKSGDKKKA